MYELSPDSETIVLLCGHFGRSSAGASPLTPREYAQMVNWLVERKESPSYLLTHDGQKDFKDSPPNKIEAHRVLALLKRGAALAIAVEDWMNTGLWVLTRADADYPMQLRKRLGYSAPPLLYGSGDQALIKAGGLAIVGSRNVDNRGLDFCFRLGKTCTEQSIPIVSGGARGVDETAMLATLNTGGRAIGVLANNLEQQACSRKYREHIMNNKLVLLSPYQPKARFHTGHAMNRNKLIYCLANWAVVVDSTAGSGGTWAGATENIKHTWVPQFVRVTKPMPKGNKVLIENHGAAPFPENNSTLSNLRAWLETSHSRNTKSLLDYTDEPPSPTSTSCSMEKVPFPKNAFEAVVPLICNELKKTELTVDQLAAKIEVRKVQMNEWLNIGVKNNIFTKLTKPVRYSLRK